MKDAKGLACDAPVDGAAADKSEDERKALKDLARDARVDGAAADKSSSWAFELLPSGSMAGMLVVSSCRPKMLRASSL